MKTQTEHAHPLSLRYRDMTDEEYTQLVEDIGANGLHEPIVMFEGLILDGRHRHRALHDLHERGVVAGVPEPAFTTFDGMHEQAEAYVRSMNLHRRHLDYDQRVAMAVLETDRLQDSGAVKVGRPDNSREIALVGKASQIAADRFGVGSRAVEEAKSIRDAAPDVFDVMLEGGIDLRKALRETRSRQRQTERETLIERAATVPPSDRYRVFQSEIGSLAERIEAGSIDAIITDPPYPKEYLHLFGDLGEFAAYALKPGGNLLVMSGQAYLPDVFSLLLPHLKYHWMLASMMEGCQSPTAPMFTHKVNCFWKPVLWFVKGEYSGDSFSDVVNGDTSDKRFHEWGQSEGVFGGLIERATKPDALILDPFCGGGTTAVAALRLSRRVICTDADPDSVNVTLGRIGEVLA